MQIVLVFVSLLVVVVNSHPICASSTKQGDKACTDNITANVIFLDKWLDLSDNSKGIDQLRRRSRNSVANKLLNSLPVSLNCLRTYMTSVGTNYADDTSVTTIRHYFNAYLMHKLYIEHLVELGTTDLLDKEWLPPTASNTYTGLTKLLKILEYNVNNLAQLLNTTCHGCTRNCSRSTEMAASLISKMNHDCNSPIYSVVFTITSHSETLYKVVKKLKGEADDQSHSNNEIDNSQTFTTDDVDDLCWCS